MSASKDTYEVGVHVDPPTLDTEIRYISRNLSNLCTTRVDAIEIVELLLQDSQTCPAEILELLEAITIEGVEEDETLNLEQQLDKQLGALIFGLKNGRSEFYLRKLEELYLATEKYYSDLVDATYSRDNLNVMLNNAFCQRNGSFHEINAFNNQKLMSQRVFSISINLFDDLDLFIAKDPTIQDIFTSNFFYLNDKVVEIKDISDGSFEIIIFEGQIVEIDHTLRLGLPNTKYIFDSEHRLVEKIITKVTGTDLQMLSLKYLPEKTDTTLVISDIATKRLKLAATSNANGAIVKLIESEAKLDEECDLVYEAFIDEQLTLENIEFIKVLAKFQRYSTLRNTTKYEDGQKVARVISYDTKHHKVDLHLNANDALVAIMHDDTIYLQSGIFVKEEKNIVHYRTTGKVFKLIYGPLGLDHIEIEELEN